MIDDNDFFTQLPSATLMAASKQAAISKLTQETQLYNKNNNKW